MYIRLVGTNFHEDLQNRQAQTTKYRNTAQGIYRGGGYLLVPEQETAGMKQISVAIVVCCLKLLVSCKLLFTRNFFEGRWLVLVLEVVVQCYAPI